MRQSKRRQISDTLLRAASVTEQETVELLREQKSRGKTLGKLLVEKRLLTEEKLLVILEEELQLPRINLFNSKISNEAVDSIPPEMARRYTVMPISVKGEKLALAMADPLNLTAIDEAATASRKEVLPVLAGESSIRHAIDQYYGMREHRDENEVITGRVIAKPAAGEEESHPGTSDGAPVVQLVDSLIRRAIEEKASDIHLEPTADGLRIRIRLDGALHETAGPLYKRQAEIISRIKIMANLDIAEKRLPQDGNIQLKKESEDINLRVSTMPTVEGEKIVIRLLEKERIVLPLDQLGFSEGCYIKLKRLLLNQSGMILVTGPTGCGKTTTLYSALHYLNRSQDNIVTIEDPVECRIGGINQIQTDHRVGRTFASTLRSVLRQDPDIIMIGEIRDLETVTIATQAALTGHLVLSTLHTNNAAGAVTRLIDMGLAPYLVSASLVGVLAQRLIRKICSYCRKEYRLSPEEKVFFRNYFRKDPPEKLYRGAKCKYCNGSGYRGRISIQELLLLNEELQGLIMQGASAVTINIKAIEQGMIPLVSDGMRCLEAGLTSMGEVVRATFSSAFDFESGDYTESNAFLAQLQKDRE